jgi:hypothetical protein
MLGSWLLKQEANMFVKMATEKRFYPNYFIVTFHGPDFPEVGPHRELSLLCARCDRGVTVVARVRNSATAPSSCTEAARWNRSPSSRGGYLQSGPTRDSRFQLKISQAPLTTVCTMCRRCCRCCQ